MFLILIREARRHIREITPKSFQQTRELEFGIRFLPRPTPNNISWFSFLLFKVMLLGLRRSIMTYH